ncbi:hypothetical protein EVAR_98953_1 [Eumeta japonica]|uniref:Uncharacterized protein n=1 Tax=Eumeta variegata TaxID=151549 RepID=A0A4C2ABP6_EUMVA|nr:hypothetical protein EVAR_98953_1 [Eumeta japonica]
MYVGSVMSESSGLKDVVAKVVIVYSEEAMKYNRKDTGEDKIYDDPPDLFAHSKSKDFEEKSLKLKMIVMMDFIMVKKKILNNFENNTDLIIILMNDPD